MRTTNHALLNAWLAKQGSLALEDLASEARIKFFTLRKIVKGEKKPSELEQRAICQATGLSAEALFPLVDAEEEAS